MGDDNELKNSYEKSTGETNVPLYKIKKRMRDAAKESAEVLDVMTDASDCKASNTCKTELQKKIEFKAKIKEITGEEPNEVETTSLLKDILAEGEHTSGSAVALSEDCQEELVERCMCAGGW